jgi:hypothetical protein
MPIYHTLHTSGTLSQKGKAKVLRDQTIEITYYPEDENGKKQSNQKKTLRLRKVCYQDEQN